MPIERWDVDRMLNPNKASTVGLEWTTEQTPRPQENSMLKQSPSLVMLRRSFLVSSAGTLAGLFLPNICPTIATPHRNNSLPENPIDEIYLQKGLNALARAHQMSSMAGHLGASLVAGYFIGKQRSRLDPVVCQGIEGDMKRVMDGESVFGKKMSPKAPLVDSQLFESFPQQQADPNLIDLIAERLAGNIQQPRQSGHNVIFASLALRGLKAAPQLATPKLVDGIVRLIGMFDNQSPGSGYYGKAKGRIHGNKIVLPDDDATPTYDDVTGMANTVLDEVIGLETNINRVGYGGMVHIINHCSS